MSLSCVLCDSNEFEDTESIDRFKIEGKIDLFTSGKNKDWVGVTRVLSFYYFDFIFMLLKLSKKTSSIII
jgi:hypothetical protein